MIILLSPSKTMDTETRYPDVDASQPPFLDDAEELVRELGYLSLSELKEVLKVSDKLAQLNYDRYQAWSAEHTSDNSRPAVYTFKGDAFVGLDAFNLSEDDVTFAEHRLVMLSGLYGVLRPLDLMQPYRLEMGGTFVPINAKSMLDFWRPKITDYLKKHLANDLSPWIMNLASTEYSSAVDFKAMDVPVISPKFLENKKGTLKSVSSYAKKARGMMTRWLIENHVDNPDAVSDFNEGGYAFTPEDSTESEPVFIR